MDNFISSEGKEVFSIFSRIKSREFVGNTGLAIKNSFFNFSSIFVAKIGSLLFTIIFARLLMPELFGLYSLALGTILIFSYFSEVGIGQTLTKFVSKEVSKNKFSKAKAYMFYLLKIKFLISTFLLLLLFLLAKPLAVYYGKPIFIVLISGSLYLFLISLSGFFQTFFQALNDFKTPFIKEIFFQFLRLAIIPLLTFYLVGKSISNDNILVFVFIGFGIIWGIVLLYLFLIARKTPIFSAKLSKLSQKEKKETNIFFMSLLTFSICSILLSYSDIFILGGFVSSESIGYYQVSMGLIGSLSALILFSNSLLPIFSRLKGDVLERGFKKTLNLTILISFSLFILSFFSSELIITLLYGEKYLPAVPFFKGLSLLLILWPFNGLYNGYFIAKGKPEIIRNLLIFTSLFNLCINFLLVIYLSQINDSLAVLGLIFGTVLSNFVYLMGCIWKKNKIF